MVRQVGRVKGWTVDDQVMVWFGLAGLIRTDKECKRCDRVGKDPFRQGPVGQVRLVTLWSDKVRKFMIWQVRIWYDANSSGK